MEALVGAVLGAVLLWLVIYTAVRGAIGDVRPEAPAFRLTWADVGESGELTLENAGRRPVPDVVVRIPAAPDASGAPLMEALLLHPGERLRVAMDRVGLGDGEQADAHERVVRVPVAGAVARTFA